MTQEMIISLAYEAIKVLLLVSLPVLSVALFVGLAVSLFQAVTQLQEMTLTFIPKILAMFATLIFLFPWMLNMMLDFTRKVLTSLPMYVG